MTMTRSMVRPMVRAMKRTPTEGVGVPAWVLSGSALDLDFANNRTYNSTGNVVSTPGSTLTVVRASAGSYFDSAGVLQQAANNALRLDYDPVTHAALGVLVEEQRTNLLLRSAEFDDASWSKATSGGVTVTGNQAVAPDGASTADLAVPGAVNGNHLVRQGPATAGAVQSWTLFVKPAGYTKIGLREDFAVGQSAAFDCSGDGSILSQTVGTTAAIIALSNGWYRLTFTGTSVSANQGLALYIFDAGYTGGDPPAYTYTGDGTSGVYIWGAQQEAGAFPTSYVPTIASQVTRAADQISILTSAFPYSAAAGTIVIDGKTAPGAGTQPLWQLDDGTENERVRIERNSSNEIHCIVTDGGVEQANVNLGTVAANTAFKVAFAWSAGDFAASLNGGTVGTDASGTLPTVTTMRIGSALTNLWGRTEKRDAYYDSRKTNAQLQALST